MKTKPQRPKVLVTHRARSYCRRNIDKSDPAMLNPWKILNRSRRPLCASGQAQLRACLKAADNGVEVIPVWNKSNREHITIGSEPASVRAAADAAVRD